MKLLGLFETIFVVTSKGSEEKENGDEGEFTFDSSTLFIIPTTILVLKLASLSQKVISIIGNVGEIKERLFVEYLCSVWVVINL